MMAATVAMEGARIVIAGAGLQGAALAYYLTLRGAKPIVVRPITWSDASSVRCCAGSLQESRI
jgi:glycine/D-amino acid oxidase-like deaminating enzyme